MINGHPVPIGENGELMFNHPNEKKNETEKESENSEKNLEVRFKAWYYLRRGNHFFIH